MMDGARFVPLTAYMMAGLLIWTAAFTLAYGVTSLVCARGLTDLAFLGLPILPLAIGAITLVALLLTGAVALMAYFRRPRDAQADGSSDRGFVKVMALGAAGLAVVGIAWNGLPALLITGCY